MHRIAITTVFTLAAALAPVARAQPAHPPTGAARADTAPASRPALDDPTIVAIFDAANTQDIESGRLAAERAHSKQVRDFGAMLARDHQQVRQQGRDLAKRLAVTPTPPKGDKGAAEHAAAMQRLRALHGAAFDRAFLAHEVAFHSSVIHAVQTTLLPAIRNAELKAFVEKVAPAFQAHLTAARNLEQHYVQR